MNITKYILIGVLGVLTSVAQAQFVPPDSNSTVMVNDSNEIVFPDISDFINTNFQLLTPSTGLSGTAYNGLTAQTWTVDRAYIEQVIRETAFVVDNYQVVIDTTPSVNAIDGYRKQLKTLEINTPYIDLSDVLLNKLNRGALYFSGGGLNGSINPSDIMSVVFTTDYQFPQSTTDQAYFATVGSNVANSGILIKFGADDRIRILINGNAFKSYKGSDIRPYINLNNNVICVILWKDLSSNIQANLYVNGNLITEGTSATVAYPTLTNNYVVGRNGASASPSSFTVQNFYIFNFDVSAEGAPYTISDYKLGKSLSPSLTTPTKTNHSLLALANYTLNGQVLDASGNGNNATVSGQVAGTNDAQIAALYKAFTGNDATASSSGYAPTVQSFQDALRAALNSDGTAYTTSYQYEDDTVVLTAWTDAEFKVLDANGNLIYWVSTQYGAQMGGGYTSHPATDLNAQIWYTCAENENTGTGQGRKWIKYVYNSTNARTIYEHAQLTTGVSTPTIGGIIIQPNLNGTTVGGTSIMSIFGNVQVNTPNTYSYVYLKCSPTDYERSPNYPYNAIWRPYNALSTAIQKAR